MLTSSTYGTKTARVCCAEPAFSYTQPLIMSAIATKRHESQPTHETSSPSGRSAALLASRSVQTIRCSSSAILQLHLFTQACSSQFHAFIRLTASGAPSGPT